METMWHVGMSRGAKVSSCLALGVLLALAAPQQPHAQERGGPRQGEPARKLTKVYYGVSACGRKCHDRVEQADDKEAVFFRGIEMHYWDAYDKHKDATRVLKEARGQQM